MSASKLENTHTHMLEMSVSKQGHKYLCTVIGQGCYIIHSVRQDIPLSKLNTPQAVDKIRWAFVSALADMLRGFKDHLIAVGDQDIELQVPMFVCCLYI